MCAISHQIFLSLERGVHLSHRQAWCAHTGHPVVYSKERSKVPTITRWFRVTHDINSDPEIWELREAFGDRAGFIWLECLSIGDRNSGVIGPVSDQTRNQLAAKCRTPRTRVGLVLDWCRTRGWLVSDTHWRIAKWRKYNKTRDGDESPSETTPRHTPIQTSPNKEKKAPSAPLVLPDWIDNQLWSDFKQMRIRLRKPMTRKAETLAMEKLADLKAEGQDPKLVIEQSILNSWQSLYPILRPRLNGNEPQREGELSEQTQRILRRGL